jgi:hypothetical protein
MDDFSSSRVTSTAFSAIAFDISAQDNVAGRGVTPRRDQDQERAILKNEKTRLYIRPRV